MSSARPAPYIEYRNVTVRYNDEVTALSKISLNIYAGEFVFFCGQTGAGKSTLLKLLSREARETEGAVLLDSIDLASVKDRDIPALRRKMGIVPQDFALLPRKRAWENVAYAMRAVGNTRREVRKKWPPILEQVGLGHRADAYPHQLSGGEQQRIAIARALINAPRLILADEPTGNLDPRNSWEIMEILCQLNDAGVTVLVSSHDMMVVERMRARARIITLESGRIVSDEPAGSVSAPAEPLEPEPPVRQIELEFSDGERLADSEADSKADGELAEAADA